MTEEALIWGEGIANGVHIDRYVHSATDTTMTLDPKLARILKRENAELMIIGMSRLNPGMTFIIKPI